MATIDAIGTQSVTLSERAAQEIAELMAFLVSPGSRWMTGSSLRMDGGEAKSI